MQFAIVTSGGQIVAELFTSGDWVCARPLTSETDANKVDVYMHNLNERYHAPQWQDVGVGLFLAYCEDQSLQSSCDWYIRSTGLWQRYYTEEDFARDKDWSRKDNSPLAYLDKLLDRYF